jgi:hypothetical protein
VRQKHTLRIHLISDPQRLLDGRVALLLCFVLVVGFESGFVNEEFRVMG